MNSPAVDFVIGATLAPSLTTTFNLFDQKIKATEKTLRTLEKSLKGISVKKYGQAHREAAQAVSYHKTRLESLHKQQNQVGVRTNIRGQLVNMAAMTTVATIPFTMAIDYEATLSGIREAIIIDDTAFKALSSDLLKLSESVPVSAQGLGEVAVAAAKAGIEQKELLRFTKDAASLSNVWNISAQNAGSALVGLRTHFQLSQGEVMLLGDAYTSLGKTMHVESGSLVNYANQVGSLAASYKLTGQQTGALGATFASLNVNTEQARAATTALLTCLGSAGTLSGEAQQAFSNLGMSGTEMANAFQNDAQGALLTFLQQTQKSPDAMKSLTTLFDADQASSIGALVAGIDTYQQALNSVNAPADYQGSTEKAFAEHAQTAAHALMLMQNSGARLAIVMGTTVLPSLVSIMQTIGPVVSGIGNFVEANSGLVQGMLTVVAGLGALKVAMLVSTWIFSSLCSFGETAKMTFDAFTFATHALTLANLRSKAATIGNTLATVRQGAAQLYTAVATKALAVRTRMATSAQWRLTAALAANPIGLVVVAVAALAGWFAYAYSQTSSLTGAVSMMWEQFKAVVPAMHLVEAAVTGVWQFFSDLFNGVSLYDAGIKLGTSLWEGVKSMLAGIQEWFVSIWDGITGIFSGSDPIDIETVDPMLAQTQKSEPKTTASTPPSTVAANPAQPGRNALAPASTPAASGPDFLNPAAPNRPGIPGNLPGSGPTVSANFSFSVNGVPDADFARRVLDALKSRKQEFEHLLGSVVNDQRRLTYGS